MKVPGGQDLKLRLRVNWLTVALLFLVAWLDWAMHRDLVMLLLFTAVAAGLLYPERLRYLMGSTRFLADMRPEARALIRGSPALLWYVVRGQGTSQTGVLVSLMVLGAIYATKRWEANIVWGLSGFFRVRDQVLPYNARAGLALVAPLLIAFVGIHGNLLDMKALLGASTTQPTSASGMGGEFLIGTLAILMTTFLLLRKRIDP